MPHVRAACCHSVWCTMVNVSDKQKISVDDAYALETPADNVDLYKAWAKTYDKEFAEAEGYVLYLHVANELLKRQSQIAGSVLDVGCGTGLVGAAIRSGGIDVVDGIDISIDMLAQASMKTTEGGEPVYRSLIPADLTRETSVDNSYYAALVSAGTFTHGHLGPNALNELWRIAAPNALAVIGVRTTHYDALGFENKFAADVAEGVITEPEIVTVNVYGEKSRSIKHADDKTHIVICRVV